MTRFIAPRDGACTRVRNASTHEAISFDQGTGAFIRTGDRPFGLVSNAGAMTLPHFAVQTAIHSALPSDAWCVPSGRCTAEVSCAIYSRCNDRSRVSPARGSDLIALKIETVLKEDMSDLPRLSVSAADSTFSFSSYRAGIYALTQ